MPSPSPKYKLHSRIALKFLFIAAISSILFSIFVVTIVHKLEQTMIATLVGHELDELLVELVKDPNARLPKTASVRAFLLSRDSIDPIPEYLKDLDYDIYNEIKVGASIYHAAVVDIKNDQLYISFETTAINQYRSLLQILLIVGGMVIVISLIVTGIWLTKRFLLPVSHLAEEVANMDPNQRNIRIEKKYQDYEVGLIANSIDYFLRKMDEFVEREQSFTAAVSHELRTPVSVITTSIDLLELKGIEPNQTGAINRIKASTNYMQKVIESLLFFARNSDKPQIKPPPLADMDGNFKDVLLQYEEMVAHKKLKLTLKSDTQLKARIMENHFEIILGNLVRNAITNTDQGSIEVVVLENGFMVKDTGRGIEPDAIEHIVERCYHGPDSKGSGLGLYLVMNICKFYGLKLDIESEVGKGSCFSIRFPQTMVAA